jgi:hypothetical protein
MSPLKAIPAVICMMLLVLPNAEGGERGPGKYSGVVVFDRWDACTLYSGIYVMYVSEGVKEKLRQHAGKDVQVDATEVRQPINPGDGLIRELVVLGAAPPPDRYVALTGLTLTSRADFKDNAKPVIVITLANTGKQELQAFGADLAPTLLMKGKNLVADGLSFALVTRQAFISGGSDPRTRGSGIASGRPYSWEIDQAVPVRFLLKPGESQRVRITFDLPPGEYDFLAGYGGGVHQEKCLASNLVAFDVTENGGKLVMAKRK